MPKKTVIKDINGRQKAINVLMYDRDAEISFHRYTDEEIIEFKTLMRHVGGVSIVAFELFKEDNGYTQKSKRPIKIGDEVISMPIREFFFGQEGGSVRSTYKQKVFASLNAINMQGTKSTLRTVDVVRLINKLASQKEIKKARTGMGVSRFIVSKNDQIIDKPKEEVIITIKETLNNIKGG